MFDTITSKIKSVGNGGGHCGGWDGIVIIILRLEAMIELFASIAKTQYELNLEDFYLKVRVLNSICLSKNIKTKHGIKV